MPLAAIYLKVAIDREHRPDVVGVGARVDREHRGSPIPDGCARFSAVMR